MRLGSIPIGAAFAQRDIVIARAALVGVTFQRDADGRVALKPLGLAAQRRLVLRIDIILVEVEEDAVGRHAGDEIFLRSGNDARAAVIARVGARAFGSGRQLGRRLFRAGANSEHGDRRDYRGGFAYRHLFCPLVGDRSSRRGAIKAAWA
jgi:hypothetical protein